MFQTALEWFRWYLTGVMEVHNTLWTHPLSCLLLLWLGQFLVARFEYRLNGGGKRVWAGYLEDLRLYNPFSSTHRIDYVRQMYGISGDFVSPHSRLWHDPDSATFAMALRENDVAKVHKMTGIVGRPWQYWGGTILAGAIVTEMIVLGILLFPVLLPISVLMTWCEWAWKTYWGR